MSEQAVLARRSARKASAKADEPAVTKVTRSPAVCVTIHPNDGSYRAISMPFRNQSLGVRP